MATQTTLSDPHLRSLLADVEAVRAEATYLASTLSDTQLTWQPAPDVWSVADCFEHLRKVDKPYVARIEEAIGRMDVGTRPYRPGFIARHFIRYISPDSTRKLKAPKAIQPQGITPSAGAEALDRFLRQQTAISRLIRAADGRDINSARFASPLLSLLKLTVGEGLTAVVRHEQRHLGQAQRVTAHPGFPSA